MDFLKRKKLMNYRSKTVIVASGRYIPENVVKNEDFHDKVFFNANQQLIEKENSEIADKFEKITGIRERRYVSDDLVTSDTAFFAAKDAIESSGIDRETLDYIIVAHNFGDVTSDNRRSDMVPSLASRVKAKLGISNPGAVCFDIVFGCPGWLQSLILADNFVRAGNCRRALIIGSETLSRVYDPHDIDSLLYSDGAGAVIVESRESDEEIGVLYHKARTDALNLSKLLIMGRSYNSEFAGSDLFLKMQGHQLYKYAITTVPGMIKDCLDENNLTLQDIDKVLIHQANEKMDVEIMNKVFDLYDADQEIRSKLELLMPMTISYLGNNSVATVPIIYDMIVKNQFEGHNFKKGDLLLFCSIGAGMNINVLLYRVP